MAETLFRLRSRQLYMVDLTHHTIEECLFSVLRCALALTETRWEQFWQKINQYGVPETGHTPFASRWLSFASRWLSIAA
jgi:hypothetical protein